MKRRNLAKFENQRVCVNAKIERFGVANTSEGKVASILLTDILVSNGQFSEKVDHMWIRINKLEFKNCLCLTDKTYISFNALIKTYLASPDYTKTQGYCFRKVRNIEPKAKNEDGVSLNEFISFMKQKGLNVLKYA